MSEILIINDDRALCRSLEIKLNHAGFDAISANTAAQGLALARAWRPRFVLLDSILQDQSGAELLPKLQNLLPWSKFLMTIAGDNTRRHPPRSSPEKEAYAFLPKPLDFDFLLRILKTALLPNFYGGAN